MKHKKTKTWVAVIDAKQVQFFAKEIGKPLKPLKKVLTASPIRTNPETRHSIGRSFDSMGFGRHIIEPHTSEKTQEKHKFVTKIIEHLQDALTRKAYDHLVLIAPPKMLGILRSQLPDPIRERVSMELHKDFNYMTPQEIGENLEKSLPRSVWR